MPKRIYGTDFEVIKVHLDEVLSKGRIVLVSDKMLEETGYILRTEYRQRWLLMNTFFGLHPEYLVLGVHTRYDHRNLRYEMIFMVTDDHGRSSLGDESLLGIFMYLLRGKIPVSDDVGRTRGPYYTSACDVSRTIPAEAVVLENMRGPPVTVKELAERVSSSETLIRLALKRLYFRGLVTIIGRKESAVGRSPYLYQVSGVQDGRVETAPA